MRILLTNSSLIHRAGSELYLYELATRLLARGHSPVAFSPRLGPLAESLRQATVPVVDRLEDIGEPPDLIHGQHHLEALTALLHFPRVPAAFVCHGWLPWEEIPPRFPRILRYVAVDWTTRERLVSERGIPPERVEVVLNFVDLARFRPRGPLPELPRRALVFSNYASEETHLPAAREACSRFGIAVEVAGVASGQPAARPESLLPAYDLVFAKGRAALEALAVGAAVILCDRTGAGPLVTSRDLAELRPLNFGIRTLRHPLEAGYLASQIERYDAADAAEVSRQIRATADIGQAVDRLLGIYQDVLAEHRERGSPAPEEESRAAAAYLRWLNPYFHDRYGIAVQEREDLKARAAALRRERDGFQTALMRERDGFQTALMRELSRRQAETSGLSQEIQAMRQTATWRLRERLLRSSFLIKAYRFLRRSASRERRGGARGPSKPAR